MKKFLKPLFIILAILVVLVGEYFVANKRNSALPYNDQTDQFVHKKPSATINRLMQREQGIYYFGFSTCPWCLELLPVLDKTLIKKKATAYIINTRGKDYTEKQNRLVEKFYQMYTKNEKLSMPFVVAINSTKSVKVQVGTVDDHDASKNKMNRKQEKKLTK